MKRGDFLGRRGIFLPTPDFPDPAEVKTPAMRLVERRFRQPIEKVIGGGPIKYVAARLGLHESTISKWRKRLGLPGRDSDVDDSEDG